MVDMYYFVLTMLGVLRPGVGMGCSNFVSHSAERRCRLLY